MTNNLQKISDALDILYKNVGKVSNKSFKYTFEYLKFNHLYQNFHLESELKEIIPLDLNEIQSLITVLTEDFLENHVLSHSIDKQKTVDYLNANLKKCLPYIVYHVKKFNEERYLEKLKNIFDQRHNGLFSYN
jgi:hypothetical protein